MIYEVTTRAAVREAGAEAFKRGATVSTNPHCPGTDAHLEWNAGYHAQKYGVPVAG